MAQSSAGGLIAFNITNPNRTVGSGGAHLTTPLNYTSVTALRAALAAFDPITYTATALDALTANDMAFALRNIQDPTTIASYMTAQVARV